MNLTELQIAVVNEEFDEVQSVLMEIDLKTEREHFQKAADHFGFKLVTHRNRCYAMRRNLASIFGYTDESGLRKLCERYNIEGITLEEINQDRGQNVRDNGVKELGLSRNDGKTIFLGWDGFLLTGAKGQNQAAQQVFTYLLKMERAGRITTAALTIAKHQDRKLHNGCKVINTLAKIDSMKNRQIQQKAIEHLDELLDGALGIGKQEDLFS